MSAQPRIQQLYTQFTLMSSTAERTLMNISPGAIIVLEVDMDQHTLKFYIDNIQQGLTISIGDDIEYWPAIAYEYCELPFDYCPKYRLISCE